MNSQAKKRKIIKTESARTGSKRRGVNEIGTLSAT